MGHANFCSFCGKLLPIDQGISLRARSERNSSGAKPASNAALINAIALSQRPRRDASFVSVADFGDREIVPPGRGYAASAVEIQSSVTQASRGSRCSECIAYPVDAEANEFGRLGDCKARFVEFDRVLSIRLRTFSGHVYNFETDDGYFCISQGAYTGNTIAANNQGNLAAYKDAAAQGIAVMKEWLSAGDDLVSEECQANEDQGPIPLDDDFDSGDDAPPLHPNCRCAIAPVVSDESDSQDEEQ
jgi:hypothetical protein